MGVCSDIPCPTGVACLLAPALSLPGGAQEVVIPNIDRYMIIGACSQGACFLRRMKMNGIIGTLRNKAQPNYAAARSASAVGAYPIDVYIHTLSLFAKAKPIRSPAETLYRQVGQGRLAQCASSHSTSFPPLVMVVR